MLGMKFQEPLPDENNPGAENKPLNSTLVVPAEPIKVTRGKNAARAAPMFA
jgi:hypothetical protein